MSCISGEVFLSVSIYKYLDYRQYLADLYAELAAKDPAMSYRAFARICNSTSPNYLQLIRDRKLNIQDDAITLISSYLDFSKKEDEYFRALIGFDHSKTSELKDTYFKTILRTREYSSISTLTKEHYQFFSHWYIPVVRELVCRPGVVYDSARIAKLIRPAITSGKVERAVDILEKLSLIVKDDKAGCYRQTDKVISTPGEVLSLAISKYHKDVITLGADAIDRFSKPERDIRSVTLGLSQEGFELLKKRMESFWQELLDMGMAERDIDRVYQINLQLFPLSDKEVTE